MKMSFASCRAVFIATAVISTVALVGAACGGDDDDDETPTAAANTPVVTQSAASPTALIEETEPAGETPAAESATVAVGDAGLVDSRGFSLYLFANDEADSGASACAGQCASAWPPLVVDGEPTAGDGVTGTLGTITRDDGTTQVTYNGLPLYFFANDQAPGDTNGKDIPNWSLAQP
jgi:predicted lipoprotein with Yx(FWY)xxD motif